ncbi:phosphoribosylglycinamide formyltransferase [Apilactobacillus timberlakei]|uniref:phosphoribosylglycinamide formyltransferase n=1 Tax=Apilactobacillus timberlakei TaxID=2008380 RepID=UPI00112C1484|nr:phosphoribosylglycinamide formyltransferase [Apilactobacillus timberlakei]TPR20124.1 phosphoribosylglycinamide formyltransferase [Apilactobacillus timberlakei]TPR20437.1 phosphoribosylglycinamide formyltransferase [Apilactobacillus timberlakei]TPR21842.1 phosphoribosylglycinamide formyltransferase [Apilactobacillus timberlakei]
MNKQLNSFNQNKKLNAAVFASGNGTNFEAIMKAKLPINIGVLVCDHHNAYVVKRAEKYHVPVFISEVKKGISKKEREKNILQCLKANDISTIFLAGYMRIVGSTLLNAFPKRILNIHPALLPNFPGKQGILDAYNANVDITGVTIHYVDAGVDTGKIIAQAKVKRYPKDSLEDLENRIHHVEHQLYPNIIHELINKGVL